jgi:DNA polymerase-3 subunit gamma/tau
MSSFQVDEIKGQETAQKYISFYLKNPNKIPPLLIFYGPESVGKWSLAERFVYRTLCLNNIGCGNCESCRLFLNNQHPDYIVFPSESKIPIGDDKSPEEFSVRWLQSKRLPYTPHLSNRRFVLFPDASLINNEAESALLKSLEEPPEHTRFIFLIDNLKKLKQTILSRGILIPFSYLPLDQVLEISRNLEIYREDFFGTTISPYDVPKEVIELIRNKISESLSDSILLLQLEAWIWEFKDKHPEWEEGFTFIKFLDLFSTIYIYELNKLEIEAKYSTLEKIFQFKEDLHKNIPAYESYLLSNLFFELTHPNE